jgi:hypothetical protein
LLTTGCSHFLRPCCCWRGTCRVGLRWRGGGWRGRSTGVARSRPCGEVQQSCAGAGPLPRAGAQLWTASFCWGGWLVLLRGFDACCAVGGGLQSEATLIDVRLDVGSLPPRSSSPTVAGCRLGGFSVGRDWWGGERIVGGVPRINICTWGLRDRLCLVLVSRGRYGLGGRFFSSFWDRVWAE